MRSAWRWNTFAKDQRRSGRSSSRRVPLRRSVMAFMAPKMAVVGVLGLGQGARVAVVLEGPVGVQHQLVKRVGWSTGGGGVVGLNGGRGDGFVEHGRLPGGEDRDRRGLRGDRKARGGGGRGPPGGGGR